jgi:hypothetical protein
MEGGGEVARCQAKFCRSVYSDGVIFSANAKNVKPLSARPDRLLQFITRQVKQLRSLAKKQLRPRLKRVVSVNSESQIVVLADFFSH